MSTLLATDLVPPANRHASLKPNCCCVARNFRATGLDRPPNYGECQDQVTKPTLLWGVAEALPGGDRKKNDTRRQERTTSMGRFGKPGPRTEKV